MIHESSSGERIVSPSIISWFKLVVAGRPQEVHFKITTLLQVAYTALTHIHVLIYNDT